MQPHQDHKSDTMSGKVPVTKGSLILVSSDNDKTAHTVPPFVLYGGLDPSESGFRGKTPSEKTIQCLFKHKHMSAVAMCGPMAGQTDLVPLTSGEDVPKLVGNVIR